MLLDGAGRLEEALCLRGPVEELDDDTREAFVWLYDRAMQNPARHIWYTNWQIVLKSGNVAIGSVGFRGPPNGRGEVKIGYGIHAAYRNNGFAAESAAALCRWALGNASVRVIRAEAHRSNPASHRVALKIGMQKDRETEESCFFHLCKPSSGERRSGRSI